MNNFKKLLMLATVALSINSIASETQLKFGMDFKRQFVDDKEYMNKLRKGPTLGIDYLFDNQGEFEWGVGSEYKLSYNSGYITEKQKPKTRVMENAPVYAIGKLNLLTSNKGNDLLYILTRAGYGFVNDTNNNNLDKLKGGLYVAGGIGSEFGPLSLETLYEKQDFSIDNNTSNKHKNSIKTVGARIGYRIGKLQNDRKPKIIEKIITKTVEVPVVIEKPVEVIKPKQINTTTNVILPFNCNKEVNSCVIRGFKVDDRTPNDMEQKELKNIATIINEFADGGSINFIGHTDSTGNDLYNQNLSVKRAETVAKLLREYGLKNSITYGQITGKGEKEPVSKNETPNGRFNNRRVELKFDNVDFKNVNFITK